MTASELTTGVLRWGFLALVPLTVGAWWVAGPAGAAGVVGGGAVALLNFRWLARDAALAAALVSEGRPRAGRVAGLGLRQLAAFGSLGLLIGTGWAPPVAVAVGLLILPPALLFQGVRAARHSG